MNKSPPNPWSLVFFERRTCVLLAALLFCLATFSACQTAPKLVEQRLNLQLSPASFGESISLTQHLKVERHGKIDELDAALEIDNEQLNIVGLAFGQRVLSIHYDGKSMQTWRHFMLPKELKEKDVLEDIQLTLWPEQALRNALPQDWTLLEQTLEQGHDRLLYHGEQLIIRIHYSEQKRWAGSVSLENLIYQYRLNIQSASNENSTP